MVDTQYFQEDLWLSEVLGKRSFNFPLPHDLAPEQIPVALASLREEVKGAPFFISTKVACYQQAALQYLQSQGFVLADTNMQFGLDGLLKKPNLKKGAVRFSNPEDEEVVAKVASESMRQSRFHADPFIADEKADYLKSEWVRNFYRGQRGDQMVVAEFDGQPKGFLQILEKDDAWIIDLIAVESIGTGKRPCLGHDSICLESLPWKAAHRGGDTVKERSLHSVLHWTWV